MLTVHLVLNDVSTPFSQMMRNGKHKIPGIEHSYFTKLFFFIGQANDAVMRKPLIFDKWANNAFFALLAQTYPNEAARYYKEVKLAKNPLMPGQVKLHSGKSKVSAYSRYVELMNSWAEEIPTSPDKVEEFLFGYKLRESDYGTNPRVEIWNIVRDNECLLPSR